jgi:hypothetical protein
VAMTAAEFLTERRDFFDVRVVEGRRGGYDIVLRLDGTYDLPQAAVEEIALGWLEHLRQLTNVPADGWDYHEHRLEEAKWRA